MTGKHSLIWLTLLCLLSINTVAFATVQIGNITIKDDGKIVFSDNSEQGTATAKGDTGVQGPQGPKGDEGPPGQVKKNELCQLYSTEGVSLPAFCSKKIIFITSQTFDGNLGGLTGADTKCQAAATSGGLSGTYKAWLSDSTMSARDRLTQNPSPYVRTDGATVANNWRDLTDGWIKDIIACDEFSACDYTDQQQYPSLDEFVWTFTDRSGIGQNDISGSTDNSCLDWTTSGQYTGFGGKFDFLYAGKHNAEPGWSYGYVKNCEEFARLYCLEQ